MNTEQALNQVFIMLQLGLVTSDVLTVAGFTPKLAAVMEEVAKADPEFAKRLRAIGVTEGI